MTTFKAIFLDRDGVLNRDHGYVYRLEDLEILPQVNASLKRLKKSGFKLIVVSNQSGVGRGFFSEEDVIKFNDALNLRLEKEARIDAFYFCPFHPEATKAKYRRDSKYRKPGTGMLEQALKENNLSREGSYMIGDKPSDITCAINFNIPGIQMSSPYPNHPSITKRMSTLAEAADFILK